MLRNPFQAACKAATLTALLFLVATIGATPASALSLIVTKPITLTSSVRLAPRGFATTKPTPKPAAPAPKLSSARPTVQGSAVLELAKPTVGLTKPVVEPVKLLPPKKGGRVFDPRTQDALDRYGVAPVILELVVDGLADVGTGGAEGRAQRSALIAPVQAALLNEFGEHLQNVKRFASIPFLALTADSDTLQKIAASPLVAQVLVDQEREPHLWTSTPHLGATPTWNAYGTRGAGVAVAILDTGFQANHPFLFGKIVSEACFSTSNAMMNRTSLCPGGASSSIAPGSAANCTISDDCEHGSHVAGIAAGEQPVFFGVAPEADIIAINVFHRVDDATVCDPAPTPCLRAFDSDAVLGLERVLALSQSMNIAAANMSFGGGTFNTACRSVYTTVASDLLDAGIAPVASAGNNAVVPDANGNQTLQQGIGSPACTAGIVSVGATDDADNIAAFSQSAPLLDLYATGVSVESSVPPSGWVFRDGTSMAAPHVTGAFALLKQLIPSASPSLFLQALQSTGTPIVDNRFGNPITTPRIQINAAADQLMNLDPWSPLRPSNLRAGQVTGTSIELFWDDNADDETRFEVCCGAYGYTDWAPANTGSGHRVRHVLDNLDPGTTYALAVKACDGSDCSGASNSIMVTTLATRPSAPRNFRAETITPSSVELLWDPPTPPAGQQLPHTHYELNWFDAGGRARFVSLQPEATTTTRTNLAANTAYTFWLAACNTHCSSQAQVTARTDMIEPVPAAPTALDVTGSTAQTVSLAWTDNADNEDVFELQWGIATQQPPSGGASGGPGSPGGWPPPGTGAFTWASAPLLPENTQAYTHGSVIGGTILRFRVRACNLGGCSAWSNEVMHLP